MTTEIREQKSANWRRDNLGENAVSANVGISTPSERELVTETADAYCPSCGDYIVNERVTYEECCDTCGTEIEWHE